MILRGTASDPLRNVTVENLTFECTDWEQPPAGNMEGFEDNGVLKSDEAYGAACQAASNLGGVISAEHAQECTLRNLIIRNVGYYAVVLGPGCRRITVAENRMEDLGAGGVRLNGGTARRGAFQPERRALHHGQRDRLRRSGVPERRGRADHA